MDNNWIEMNLQRQRKMLEDKQKQKRHQSAGSVRTTTSTLSMGNSFNDFPSFDTSTPTFPPDLMTSSVSNSALHAPIAAPRSQPRSSNPMRSAPIPATEQLISISDSSDQEISAKLSKANLSKTVVSDDEEDEAEQSIDPWRTSTEEAVLSTDRLPDFAFIKNNLIQFIEDPVAQNCLYKCTITRQKNGMDKGMFPTYYLHLEEGEHDRKVKIFLLAARKRKKSATANYLISYDPTNLSREGDGYCAKVRSNALGTHFTIYDRGMNRKKTNNQLAIRQELAAVVYETNVLGFKGPRKMTVIVPALEVLGDDIPKRQQVRPLQDTQTLLERYKTDKSDALKVLHNKSPQWNDETQSYVLNFHGRVTQASVKNFQIIHNQSPEYIIMQFGRVSDDEFTMDFRYPLSVIQAFGIAMTSFHGKLACE